MCECVSVSVCMGIRRMSVDKMRKNKYKNNNATFIAQKKKRRNR